MAKVGSTTVHLTAYIFLRDSVSCAKLLLLLILPPLSHFRHGIIPSQHSVFCFFCVFFFFMLHSISISFSLSIPLPSTYFLLPLTGHQLSPGCYLYFLYHFFIINHVYLILVCKLSWEDCSTLQCKAQAHSAPSA